MRRYRLKNKLTNEYQLLFMTEAQRDAFLDAHPDWFWASKEEGAPIFLHSPYSNSNRDKSETGGELKTDDGFREVLSKIAEQNPNSPMADTYGSKSVKDVNTRQAVKKAVDKSNGLFG